MSFIITINRCILGFTTNGTLDNAGKINGYRSATSADKWLLTIKELLDQAYYEILWITFCVLHYLLGSLSLLGITMTLSSLTEIMFMA